MLLCTWLNHAMRHACVRHACVMLRRPAPRRADLHQIERSRSRDVVLFVAGALISAWLLNQG